MARIHEAHGGLSWKSNQNASRDAMRLFHSCLSPSKLFHCYTLFIEARWKLSLGPIQAHKDMQGKKLMLEVTPEDISPSPHVYVPVLTAVST